MRNLLLRWITSAAALGIVAWLLPGIVVGGGIDAIFALFVGTAILGFVNMLVKPVLTLLSCPLILLSLGLFLFVINAGMLLLASQLSQAFGHSFYVAGWPSAIVGSILLTIVNWFLSGIVHERNEQDEQ
jgi:putative membrane protein